MSSNSAPQSIKKSIPSVPPDLRDFDSLPDCAFVRQKVVQRLLCCSSATLWRRIQDKTFPAPVRLSNRVSGWHVGTLRKVLAEKLEGAK